jgi:hypothetical protein
MYFSSVNLVYKIINKSDIRNLLIILIHSTINRYNIRRSINICLKKRDQYVGSWERSSLVWIGTLNIEQPYKRLLYYILRDSHPTPHTSFSPLEFPFLPLILNFGTRFPIFFALNTNFGMYFPKFLMNLN